MATFTAVETERIVALVEEAADALLLASFVPTRRTATRYSRRFLEDTSGEAVLNREIGAKLQELGTNEEETFGSDSFKRDGVAGAGRALTAIRAQSARLMRLLSRLPRDHAVLQHMISRSDARRQRQRAKAVQNTGILMALNAAATSAGFVSGAASVGGAEGGSGVSGHDEEGKEEGAPPTPATGFASTAPVGGVAGPGAEVVDFLLERQRSQMSAREREASLHLMLPLEAVSTGLRDAAGAMRARLETSVEEDLRIAEHMRHLRSRTQQLRASERLLSDQLRRLTLRKEAECTRLDDTLAKLQRERHEIASRAQAQQDALEAERAGMLARMKAAHEATMSDLQARKLQLVTELGQSAKKNEEKEGDRRKLRLQRRAQLLDRKTEYDKFGIEKQALIDALRDEVGELQARVEVLRRHSELVARDRAEAEQEAAEEADERAAAAKAFIFKYQPPAVRVQWWWGKLKARWEEERKSKKGKKGKKKK